MENQKQGKWNGKAKWKQNLGNKKGSGVWENNRTETWKEEYGI